MTDHATSSWWALRVADADGEVLTVASWPESAAPELTLAVIDPDGRARSACALSDGKLREVAASDFRPHVAPWRGIGPEVPLNGVPLKEDNDDEA